MICHKTAVEVIFFVSVYYAVIMQKTVHATAKKKKKRKKEYNDNKSQNHTEMIKATNLLDTKR